MNKSLKRPLNLSDTIHCLDSEYNGMYRGTVLNTDDPEHRGRAKVFVYGVYDEELFDTPNKLPWAEPCQPLFCGGKGEEGNNGVFQCPDLKSTVWLFFESGDITRPVMFGQTTDKNGKFDSNKCTLYWDGMYIDMDKTTHTVSVSAENIDVTASNNLTAVVNNDAYINVDNNIVMVAGNNLDITANSNVNISASSININGDTTITGTCHITGATTVDADAKISNISFLSHKHPTAAPGSPSTPI